MHLKKVTKLEQFNQNEARWSQVSEQMTADQAREHTSDAACSPPATFRQSPVVWLLVRLIWLYRLTLSPWIGRSCRFFPTCSRYAEEALLTHGAWRGSVLAAKRLSKCHPFHEGGIDEVPRQI